jgi:hypothetical protein
VRSHSFLLCFFSSCVHSHLTALQGKHWAARAESQTTTHHKMTSVLFFMRTCVPSILNIIHYTLRLLWVYNLSVTSDHSSLMERDHNCYRPLQEAATTWFLCYFSVRSRNTDMIQTANLVTALLGLEFTSGGFSVCAHGQTTRQWWTARLGAAPLDWLQETSQQHSRPDPARSDRDLCCRRSLPPGSRTRLRRLV